MEFFDSLSNSNQAKKYYHNRCCYAAGTGWTVSIDQTIEKPEERDPGNTKSAGIISRIFKKETCVKCGASIQKDQIYCNMCGRKLQ